MTASPSGGAWIVDLALAVLALEIPAAAVLGDRNGRQARLATMAIAALPGACLLLALHASVEGDGWLWIALWLTASFPAHLADLSRRRQP